MAQTGFTPISNYYSATAAAVPTAGNLVAGELAINTADGKLFYKDSAGVVQTMASKAGNVNVSSFSGGTTGLTPNTATTGVVTLAGTLAVANGGTGVTTSTGSGNVVLSTSPTLVTPALGTPSAIVLTNATGLGYSALPAGSVLQVVNANYSTEVTSATTTYADTGLTATITPKFSTSKILVLVGQNGIYRDNLGATYLGARLVRGSTTILNFEGIAAYISVPTSGSTGVGGISCTYLDSPATTSATTYKTQFASGGNVGTMRLQAPAGGQISTSTITLMEIAG